LKKEIARVVASSKAQDEKTRKVSAEVELRDDAVSRTVASKR
jgi:hypothetical protein